MSRDLEPKPEPEPDPEREPEIEPESSAHRIRLDGRAHGQNTLVSKSLAE